MAVENLYAICCRDTIALDPPGTEYLMVRSWMEVDLPDGEHKRIETENPYHVSCLKAGKGLKEGVAYETIPVPGIMGTRRVYVKP